jgi:3-hydroxyacyl-CoA dehydrogenase/enoyl-CoA hydratase/3-hydroxybutyryl-CoA epimerase
MKNHFSTEVREKVAVLSFNRSDKDMNILGEVVLRELESTLKNLEKDSSLRGVVIASSKKDQFIVGADISEIAALDTKEKAFAGSQAMQQVLNLLSDFKKPTVAAIHGSCLGGGLELSLACSMRVASKHSTTKMGLPEIQLGLIPGAGGTQRLPRLIGIQAALDLILTGKTVVSDKALKLGLVDRLAPEANLVNEGISLILSSFQRPPRKESHLAWALESNLIGRRVLRQQATKMTLSKTKGFYPAAPAAIDAIFRGFDTSLIRGLKIESEHFGELAQTVASKSLIHLFNATTAIKKHPYKEAGDKRFKDKGPVKDIGVVGGGFMGSGIANVCADKGIRVAVSDPSKESLGRLVSSAKSFFGKKLKTRRIKSFEYESKIAHITPSLTPSGFSQKDLVVEAVFEDLKLKQKILSDIEANSHEDWIFASNTSALPIADVAKASRSPERVLGMHFFSPVEKMPLLEIVNHPTTAPWATARAIELGNKMGKTIIVVKDSPGFYTTRVLAFYLAEAAILLGEGCKIDLIDRALTNLGWPVGPMALIDEVGIDVGLHVMDTMCNALPGRFTMSSEFQVIKQSGRLGRKNGKGFYKYVDGKKTGVDESIYGLLKSNTGSSLSERDIADRCMLGFVNECLRCLEEGIIPTAYDGDVGAVFGLGFPPFLGGPFKFVDLNGAKTVLQKLTDFAVKYGPRFQPCDLLKEMSKTNKKFFEGERN